MVYNVENLLSIINSKSRFIENPKFSRLGILEIRISDFEMKSFVGFLLIIDDSDFPLLT